MLFQIVLSLLHLQLLRAFSLLLLWMLLQYLDILCLLLLDLYIFQLPLYEHPEPLSCLFGLLCERY
jgi:hypothetical protein